MAVKTGDVLYQIDPTPFTSRVESIKAQLVMSRADLVRANKLLSKSAIAVRDQEIAQTRVNQLEADLISAQYDLNWGDECDGWWLHQNEKFTVISERMPPDTAEKQRYHSHTDQFFYCLEGDLDIQIGHEEHKLKSQDGLFVPAKALHKVMNRSTEQVQFLVISCPNSHHDRIDLESLSVRTSSRA